jgi:hypothetical protein
VKHFHEEFREFHYLLEIYLFRTATPHEAFTVDCAESIFYATPATQCVLLGGKLTTKNSSHRQSSSLAAALKSCEVVLGNYSHLNPPTHSNIETSVKRTVAETAPGVAVVITTDETLATYGVNGFSVDRGQDGKSPLHGARDRF